MSNTSLDTAAIEKHIEYLYTIPIEALMELKSKVTEGAYSKMLLYVYMDRTLPKKQARSRIKV